METCLVITVIVYALCEAMKLIPNLNTKALPAWASLFGGILGVAAYAFGAPILAATDAFTAFAIGIVSGLASVGVFDFIKNMKP